MPLPTPVRTAGRAALELADPAVVAWTRWRSGEREPIPPRRVRARSGAPSARHFLPVGRQAVAELDAALQTRGARLADFSSVLDFGAGNGRVLRHAIEAASPGTSLCGTDVDAEAIAWAARHHPGARWAVNSFQPPLPCPGDEFDLVYSISIFSHLDAAEEHAWLGELARVMRPGATALLTVHGPHAFGRFARGEITSAWCPPERLAGRSLDEEGLIYEPYTGVTRRERRLPGIDGSFGLAFHSPEYVHRRWAEHLEVLDLLPRAMTQWQDIVVCRARAPVERR